MLESVLAGAVAGGTSILYFTVPDIGAALRVLDLGKADVTPLLAPDDRSPQRPSLGLA